MNRILRIGPMIRITSIRSKTTYPTSQRVRFGSIDLFLCLWISLLKFNWFQSSLKVDFIQGKSAVGKPAALQPFRVDIEKGKSYAWCACGASKKQVYMILDVNLLFKSSDLSIEIHFLKALLRRISQEAERWVERESGEVWTASIHVRRVAHRHVLHVQELVESTVLRWNPWNDQTKIKHISIIFYFFLWFSSQLFNQKTNKSISLNESPWFESGFFFGSHL